VAEPGPLPAAFSYRGGILHCEGVPLPELAAGTQTPAYVYSAASMTERYRAFEAAVAPLGGRICYAVKANSNQAVIRTFAMLGAGADVVSEGEFRRALAAGIDPAKIVFSGVAKTADELRFALDAGVGQINVESAFELDLIGRLVSGSSRKVRIALRVNPDIDARTHPKIATARAGSKFGIPYEQAAGLYERAAAMPGLEPTAIALHIGSQLMELDPFEAAFSKIGRLIQRLRDAGRAIEHIDLGGGLGIDYTAGALVDLERYARIVERTLGGLGCSLTFEPGRALVAAAGILLTRVIAVKQLADGFAILQDGAMNDLIRPTLYEAYHPIWPVRFDVDREQIRGDVVGPVCESGDFLALDRALPRPDPGDLLAVGYAGAYGAVMSSTYNSRPLLAEIMVHGSDWSIVRHRQTYDALIEQDIVPPWLAKS
jgi:diaminopimelate decarboxylase